MLFTFVWNEHSKRAFQNAFSAKFSHMLNPQSQRQITLLKSMRQHLEEPWCIWCNGPLRSLSDWMWALNISISALLLHVDRHHLAGISGLVGVRTGSLCCAAGSKALVGDKTYVLMLPFVCTHTGCTQGTQPLHCTIRPLHDPHGFDSFS